MPILWAGVERFADPKDYEQWLALVLAEQRQLAKARVIAEKAAFDDLPPNEQRTYIAHAVTVLKELEKERKS